VTSRKEELVAKNKGSTGKEELKKKYGKNEDRIV
jgi:hypothetical protein